MSTSLAAQLKKLEAPQTQLLVHKKERPSFLFDTKEAASFDRDKFYELGLSGLEELKNLNPYFSVFENTLFDIASKSFERSVQSQEVNDKINDQIKTFLTLLSPYFQLKAAHKAIEWLINRYHIESFNIDDIMFLILPYHETMEFAQMLRILTIKNNSGLWYWLYDIKKKGIPLSKTVLLTRASTDMAFLKFVCGMPAQGIKIYGSRASNLVTLFAFYCVTVIGGLEYADKITELHIMQVFPSILAGLSSSLEDYTASSFMIIARLATKTCLSSKVLSVLFNKISEVEHSKLRFEISLLLCNLCQNNDAKCEFPEKAVEKLAESRWLVSSLVAHHEAGYKTSPFITLLLKTCLKLVQKDQDKYKPFVESLLNDMKYDSESVSDIFRVLLEEFDEGATDECVKWFSELLKDLELSFPKVFDSIVSTALSHEESKSGAAVKTILGINTSRNDLFLKLVHPNEDVRLQAVKYIAKHFEPSQLAWLKQTLLERLRDDSPKVVRQVLRLPSPLIATLRSDDGYSILIGNLVSVIARFGGIEEPIIAHALNILSRNCSEEHNSLFLIAVIPHISVVLNKSTDLLEGAPEQRWPFLTSMKTCADTKSKPISVLWKSLTNPDNIPSIENIISTLNEWEALKAHSAFWFSSAMLIAGKLSDHLSQETGDLIMDFLIQYLKFPKLVSLDNVDSIDENTLEQCIEVSINGNLPVHGALHCLNTLSHCIKLSTKKPWLDLTTKSNAFSMSIFRVLHEGCKSEEKPVRVSFTKARSSFFQNHFPEAETQVHFLINALILEPSLDVQCLDVAVKIIEEDSNVLSSILKENSLVVPSLLILLNSPSESVRSGALNILSLLPGSLSTGFYRTFVEELLAHSSEILLDCEQILFFLYKEFSVFDGDKRKKSVSTSMESTMRHLFSIVTNSITPSYAQFQLLNILQFVNSKDILLELLPLASRYFGATEDLDNNASNMVIQIFKRLDCSVTEVLKDERFWNNFKIALSDHKTVIHLEEDDTICPAALILKQITKEFYDNIPEPKSELREKLLSVILEKVTDLDNVDVVKANSHLFKKISLDSNLLVKFFTPMVNVFVPHSPSMLRARQRRRSGNLPSLETLSTFEWKRGVYLLELIQDKKKINDIHLLLPIFFSLLAKCLQFEQQAPVEYSKQLLLSSILHCCQKLSDSSEGSIPLEGLQADIVVECVRASQNPLTHHHALLTLSHLAHIMPVQILDNLMPVFTFIGSSVLRQEDAYSFQLISKIIETVIPILVKHQRGVELEEAVTNVLREFVSTILDIPEHRRMPLFKKLLTTLNNGEFMWIFLALVFEKHVLNYSNQDVQEKQKPGTMPKILEYALQLCFEFTPAVLLDTCHKLFIYILQLPNDKDSLIQRKFKYTGIKALFNIEENTPKNFRHYKYTLLSFLSSLMSSKHFVKEIGEISEEEMSSLKDVFSYIVERCLVYIKNVSVQLEASHNTPNAKYWKTVLNLCYDILDKTNALLPTDIFIGVVEHLLKHPIDAVRRKAMEVLGWKLQQPVLIPAEDLRRLLDPLVATLDSVESESSENEQDSQITLQAALLALKLMARHLSEKYLEDFEQVLHKVSEILASRENLNGPVLGSLVLCLGELVSTLKAHSIAYLPTYMPVLISILHDNISNESCGDLLLLSTVTSVQKVIETIPQLLSPYMKKLLYEVSILSAKYGMEISELQSTKGGQSISLKLKSIRSRISNDVPTRVLVPAASSAHKKLMSHSHYSAIGPLMMILSDRFTSAADLSPETVKLFLMALEFRSDQPALKLEEIESVETPVILAVTKLILKLSELPFRQLYQRIFDWSIRKAESRKESSITFYRLSSNIAKSLKSLFSLFVGIFIENSAELLRSNNAAKSDAWFDNEFATEKSILLIESIFETFSTMFCHDTKKFLTKDYFNLLMDPFVDQLENRIGGDQTSNERCTNLIIPCIAGMATSTGDESLWKHLNHKILLKTRHTNAEVRIIALKATCALAEVLGEDFMPLLPETVPFLAELLEDDVEEVEQECQKIVNRMEEVLGESIQSYF